MKHLMNKLGETGLKVFPIGFGGIPIQRLTQDKINLIFEEIYRSPINFLDTARAYSTSEESIGIAIKHLKKIHGDNYKNKFIIATKSPKRDFDGMWNDILISVELLGKIDLYQCHLVKTDEQYERILEGALPALRQAQKQGLINKIGITAHNAEFLMKYIDDMPFDTIQFPYNIVETQGEELFRRARELGIGSIVMKPLAGGAIENAGLAMRFAAANDDVSVIIPGMDSPEQVAENVAALETDFTEADAIESAKIRQEMGNQFCRRCGYCMPCTVGIDIPTQFLFEGYKNRYSLKGWAEERYAAQKIDASACIKCGKCLSRCPYDLPIIEMLERVESAFK